MSEQYYKVKGQHLTDTANVIREKLTSEDTFKPSEFSEKVGEVYDSGYSKAELDTWNALTNNTARRNYRECFRNWGGEYFRPPFPIKFGTGAGYFSYTFSNANIKKFEKGYFDFSAFNPSTNDEDTKSIYYTFQYCSNLEEFEDIGLPAGGYHFPWLSCSKLRKVEVLRSTVECTHANPFKYCYELVDIKFAGEIGNNISFAQNSKLSYESLTAPGEEVTIMLNGVETTEVRKGLIHALYDFVGNGETTTKTLTLHADAKARLTADDIKTITDKGWTLV